jgi:hypothetical protein
MNAIVLLLPLLFLVKPARRSTGWKRSNTTNRILDVLKEERPSVICIDELDEMSRQFQKLTTVA